MNRTKSCQCHFPYKTSTNLEGAKPLSEVWTDCENLEVLKTLCKLSPKQV